MFATMNYTIEKIVSVIDGKLIGNSNNDLVIKDLLFDSRLIVIPENTLFFALNDTNISSRALRTCWRICG